ncbi:MAG: hypothetical protein M0R02_13995, partial [Bacteroidales bacterium]|nr:hypothetical protein [Bacteroidales bacterium]
MNRETSAPLLIRHAQLYSGEVVDVRVEAGVIAALGESLPSRPGEHLVEASGGLLLPGLQDHHLHLFATAAARESLVCGPPQV